MGLLLAHAIAQNEHTESQTNKVITTVVYDNRKLHRILEVVCRLLSSRRA